MLKFRGENCLLAAEVCQSTGMTRTNIIKALKRNAIRDTDYFILNSSEAAEMKSVGIKIGYKPNQFMAGMYLISETALNRLKDMKEEQEDLFKPALVKADEVNQIDTAQMLVDSVFAAMKSFYVGATITIDKENKRVTVEFLTR